MQICISRDRKLIIELNSWIVKKELDQYIAAVMELDVASGNGFALEMDFLDLVNIFSGINDVQQRHAASAD